jgi:hypothetical protein
MAKKVSKLVFSIIILFAVAVGAQEVEPIPLQCTDEPFVMQDAPPSNLYLVDPALDPTFTFNSIGTAANTDPPKEYNNIGFASDGYIYAVELTSNNTSQLLAGNRGIVRIGLNTAGDNIAVQALGWPGYNTVTAPWGGDGNAFPRFDAGDVNNQANVLYISVGALNSPQIDTNGNILNPICDDSSVSYNPSNCTDKLYIVDLSALPAVGASATDLSGAVTVCPIRQTNNNLSNPGNVNDWAYNSADGMLYGGNAKSGKLVKLNPVPDANGFCLREEFCFDPAGAGEDPVAGFCSSGTRQALPKGLVAPDAYGAAWSKDGHLFVYRNGPQGASTVYEIDVTLQGTENLPRIIAITEVERDTPRNDGTACVAEDQPVPFECTGEAYIIQTYEGQLIQVDQSGPTFTFTDIPGGPAGYEINNIGFRTTDGLIYGWKRCGTTSIPEGFQCAVEDQEIVTIDANHTVTGLGRGNLPDPVSTNSDPFESSKMRFFSGDVSPDGTKMYLNWNGGGIIYTVDLPALTVAADPSITITPLNPINPIKICTTDSTAGPCGRVADWAAHPTNGMLYGGNDTNKKVAILDPATGARRDWGVTCGGGSDCLGTSINGFGAAWFNAAGNLFLYNNDGTIYEVANVGDCIPSDTDCADLVEVVSVQTGPSSTFNDGAACVDIPESDVSVIKTAGTSIARFYDWTISKEVSPAEWSLFAGDSGTSIYTVTVDKVLSQETYDVAGTIVVSNNGTADVTINSVSDEISGDPPISAVIDCGVSFPYELSVGSALICTYSASLPDGTIRTNTATVSTDAGDFTASAEVTFAGVVPSEINSEITVSDTNGQFWGSVSDDTTWTYDLTFTCSSNPDDYTDGVYSIIRPNTATINETGATDDASVTLNCYAPVVTKDAATSFDRSYNWTIDKAIDEVELTLSLGQQIMVEYSVTVDAAPSDGNFAVAGTITVQNPHPTALMEVSISDLISPDIVATLDCGGSLTIPANSSATCGYTANLPDGTTRKNTATATLNGIDFSSSVHVFFSDTPVNEIDECVDVIDTQQGTLGTNICADAAPTTFTYSDLLGSNECGEHTFTNTASFKTNDTETVGADSVTVILNIPCDGACTLTPGYWKTHSQLGPAPYDDTWAELPNGQDTQFFDTGQTWYEVLWTPSAEGNAYYILARAYAAATLNALNGADVSVLETACDQCGSGIENCLIDAGQFLDQYDQNFDDLKGKTKKVIRATFICLYEVLDSYNNGEIGPGHCSDNSFNIPGQCSE